MSSAAFSQSFHYSFNRFIRRPPLLGCKIKLGVLGATMRELLIWMIIWWWAFCLRILSFRLGCLILSQTETLNIELGISTSFIQRNDFLLCGALSAVCWNFRLPSWLAVRAGRADRRTTCTVAPLDGSVPATHEYHSGRKAAPH